jgi:hypothetical protein
VRRWNAIRCSLVSSSPSGSRPDPSVQQLRFGLEDVADLTTDISQMLGGTSLPVLDTHAGGTILILAAIANCRQAGPSTAPGALLCQISKR